ncbi:MAG TPA: ChbG/HpnK family deacetylase [Candidatus Xenobia bacterium]|jgi:predicted glycoside hydrolase/deacetylase ChbG (UPF0249 family)
MTIDVHSDDVGATAAVTEQTLDCWRQGVLTGFSVLANGEALGRLATVLSEEAGRGVRIACHLNLSEGPSSAPAADVPLLVDRQGHLRHTFGSLILTWLRARGELTRQVETEWQAQVAALQARLSPRSVHAVDGHMHVHMLPFLFPAAARVAAASRVRSIRMAREPLYLASPRWPVINLVKWAVLRFCSGFAEPFARRAGLTWPDRLVGILYSGHMTVEAAWAGLAAARREGARHVEVVFHVGRAAEAETGRWQGREFMAEFYRSEWRDRELQEAARLKARLG